MTTKLRSLCAVELEDQDKSVSDLLDVSPDELNGYQKVVKQAVNGSREAIEELYNSGVLHKISSKVARMIAGMGAAPWDIAIAKEDIVHTTVVELLSACTYHSTNELTRLLYTAASNNVIDIKRRTRKVSFDPLGDIDPCSPGLSLQTQIEHAEWARAWNRQMAIWLTRLRASDQFILTATMRDHPPRAIAGLMFGDGWTKLTKSQQNHLSEQISRRLYKLKAKLAKWVRTSAMKVPDMFEPESLSCWPLK